MSLDIGGLLLLLGFDLLVYLGWLAATLGRPWPLAEIMLAAFVGWLCQVIGTELLLGLAGRLTAGWLAGANLILALLLLGYGARRLRRGDLRRHASAGAAALRQVARSPMLLLVLLLALWSGWALFLGLIFPPYGYDELFYHMTIAASILQQGSVAFIPSYLTHVEAFPKNSELLAVWNSIFFHRDTFADLAMLPFFWAGGLGVYAAGRRLGASVVGALAGGAVFWAAPTVLIHAKSTYNDLMIGALWAIGLCFALQPIDDRRAYPDRALAFLLTGATAGLLLGTKISGPVYVLGLAAILLPRLARLRDAARIGGAIAVFGAAVLALGGYWYISNILRFGNPLWPFPVRAGGHTIFAGISPTFAEDMYREDVRNVANTPPGWRRLLFAWFDRQSAFSVDSRLAGLGPIWAIVALPSLLLWVGASLYRRRWQGALVALAHAGLLAAIPLNWVPRYVLFLLALGGCAVAVAHAALTPWARRWLAWLTAALAVFAAVNSVDFLFFSVERIRAFAGLPERERTAQRFDPGSFGPSYQWIARFAPAGSTVAYGNQVMLPYPLWGPSFERRVVWVPPRDESTYVDRLRAAGVRFVFASADGKEAKLLAGDRRARLAFDGGDGWKIFEVS